MKKSLIIALALVFALGIAATAFAAANPFVDVPAKHWAYESVAKLAKAGIVTGYGDGTFRGDRTMTRYEMAAIVAKAMANQDKANAEQKTEIAKLQAEFSDELDKLGVRVTALENKVGNIKFTGEVRTRYEYAKDVAAANAWKNPNERNRLRLGMEAQVADGWTFKGRLTSENAPGSPNNFTPATGRTLTNNGSASTYDVMTAYTVMDRAYITGKPFGLNEFSLGRQGLFLGQGMVAGSTTPEYDGVKIAFGKDIQVQTGALKAYAFSTAAAANNENFLFGDVKFILDKTLNVTATYIKDKDGLWYKTWTAGLCYTGISNIVFTGEYGKNSATYVQSNGNDAKAWFYKAKWMAATPKKVNSWDLYAMYSKADAYFEAGNYTAFDTGKVYSRAFDNKKGMTYGFDWTVFQNGIFGLAYYDTKQVTNEAPVKSWIAQLTYTF